MGLAVVTGVCSSCGDALMSFVDELEDGSIIYVIVCPTCYRHLKITPMQSSYIITALVQRLVEFETNWISKVAGAMADCLVF